VLSTTSNVEALPKTQRFGSVDLSTVHSKVKLPGVGPGGIGGGGPGVGPASVLASKKHPVEPSARQAPAKMPAQRDTRRVLIVIELMDSPPSSLRL
jgi:hypothetical protein